MHKQLANAYKGVGVVANTLREKLHSLKKNHNRITLITAVGQLDNLRVINVKEDFAKFRQVHSKNK
jgi:hypothetical protein